MDSPTHLAYLSLGSNLGDREKNLKEAAQKLNDVPVRILRCSSIYRTSPVDYLDQNWFLNQVIALQTVLAPESLLDRCLQIENEMGRIREIPKGPRTMDIDLLLYDDLIQNSERLTLPHPRLHLRKFVLVPLAEIDPHKLIPTFQKTAPELMATLTSSASDQIIELYRPTRATS